MSDTKLVERDEERGHILTFSKNGYVQSTILSDWLYTEKCLPPKVNKEIEEEHNRARSVLRRAFEDDYESWAKSLE